MAQLSFLFLLAALALIIILQMFFSLKKANHRPNLGSNTGLLSHDFFISLMFIFSMWLMIFLLYATKNLDWNKKQIMVSIISVFAACFIWWWRKQFGARS